MEKNDKNDENQDETRKPSDSAYKYLFSNTKIFYQLISRFVDLDFVKQIKLENLVTVDKSFIADDMAKRESDIIYQVNMEDRDFYIYILVEFQSTVDKSIPIRMLLYILHLYDLIYRESEAGKLPSIFPILLYSGNKKWTIPYKVQDLIHHHIPSVYIPRFSYYPIIENAVPPEKLKRLKGLVAAVFYLEQQDKPEKLSLAIENVLDFLVEEQPEEIRMFSHWLNGMFQGALTPEIREKMRKKTKGEPMITQVARQIWENGVETIKPAEL